MWFTNAFRAQLHCLMYGFRIVIYFRVLTIKLRRDGWFHSYFLNYGTNLLCYYLVG